MSQPALTSRTSQDRRRSPRLLSCLRVDYCPLIRPDGEVSMGSLQRGIAANLGNEGLLMRSRAELPNGALLHLFLRLPDVPGNPIACYARVVRRGTDPGTYGLRIERVRQQDRRRLERYIMAQVLRRRTPPPLPRDIWQ